MEQMELRDVSPTDLDRILEIRIRSFGPMSGDRDAWRKEATEFAEAGRYLCVTVRGEPVAAARIWDFSQFWHGRPVSTAGIGGVVVAPEHRGRGVASLLMRGILDRSRLLGHSLTSLYPATVALYRRLGYEYGGARHRWTFDAKELRSLTHPGVAVRRGGPDDALRLLELVARVRAAGRESGPLLWGERWVREWLAEETTFCYLAEDGFVVYTWDERDVVVDELVAASPGTARTLLALAGSGASVAKRVHVRGAPHDPVHLVVGEEAAHESQTERWMLRVLDAPAAVAARGWPTTVRIDTLLRLDDPEVPANAGTWRLTVERGEGTLTPAADDGTALDLGPRGLAALFAGTPMAALRGAGLVEGGDPVSDSVLDSTFGTGAAYLLDYF